jgi:hypothetical protein
LEFSENITLVAGDIVFSPTNVATPGTPTGSGKAWRVPITVLKTDKDKEWDLTVRVSKEGFRVAGARTVKVKTEASKAKDTSFSASANGGATSTTNKLTLTFGEAIPGLSTSDITLGDPNVRKGLVEKIGDPGTYTMNISGVSAGELTVTFAKAGYQVKEAKVTVIVYKRPPTGALTDPLVNFKVDQPAAGQTTKSISIKFDQVIPGLLAEDILLSISGGNGTIYRGILSQPRIEDGKAVYTLWFDGEFDWGITLQVDAVKDGLRLGEAEAGDSSVMIYYYKDSTFSLSTREEDETTKFVIMTFSVDPVFDMDNIETVIDGFLSPSADISGLRIVEGSVTKEGAVYTFGVAGFAKDGTLTVTVARDGIDFAPESAAVSVYYVAKPIDTLDSLVTFLSSAKDGEHVKVKLLAPLEFADFVAAISPPFIPDGKTVFVTLDLTEHTGITGIDGELDGLANLYGLVIDEKIINLSGAFDDAFQELTLEGPLFIDTDDDGDSEPIPGSILGIDGLKVIINANQTESIFSGSALPAIEFGTGINTITTGLFKGVMTTTEYTVPVGITKIEAGAFETSSLSKLIIKGSLVSIEDDDDPGPSTWASPLTTVVLEASPAASVVFPAAVVNVELKNNANVIADNFGYDSSDPPQSVVATFKLNGTVKPVLADFVKVTTIDIGPTYSGFLTGSDFEGLSLLTAITVDSTNITYKTPSDASGVLASFDGKTLIKSPAKKFTGSAAVLPAGVTIIGESAFKGSEAETITWTGAPVTAIRANAFEGAALTTALTIPASVLSIGDEAFKDCGELLGATIGAGVITIGDSAFEGCAKFATLTIGAAVTTIGESAFEGTVITAITIPNAVTSLGASAFKDCVTAATASTVTIGTGLTSIPENAFQNNTKLTTLTFSPTSLVSSIAANAFDGCDALGVSPAAAVSLPPSLCTIEAGAFASTSAGVKAFTINGPLASIGAGAFPVGTTVEVTKPMGAAIFPNTVASVTLTDDGVVTSDNFSTMDGVTITFGGTVAAAKAALLDLGDITSLGILGASFGTTPVLTGADFSALTSLEEIKVIGTHTVYSEGANGELLGGVTKTGTLIKFPPGKSGTAYAIPASVTIIGDNAFEGAANNFTTIAIPATITAIGDNAFRGCSRLTTLTFTGTSTLATVGDGAFVGTKLEEIEFTGALLSRIGTAAVHPVPPPATNVPLVGAFQDVKTLTTVIIAGLPAGITLGANTFKGCEALGTGATGVVTLGTVKVIGESAFEGCGTSVNNATTGLGSIAITASVTDIEKNAFRNCYNLSGLTFTGTPSLLANIRDGAFTGTKLGPNIVLGDSAVNPITFGSTPAAGVTPVGVFQGVTTLQSITLPSGALARVVIGANTFNGCSGLVLAPTTLAAVTTIGEGAFKDCAATGFTALTIPLNVQSIGKNAFNGCASLTGVTVSATSGLKTIGDGAFYGTKLTAIDFGDAVITDIGTIPASSDPAVSQGAFEGTPITGITLDALANAVKIGGRAFFGCTNLAAIPLVGVTNLGVSAFEGCTNAGVTALTIPAGLTAIGARAFAGCDKLTALTLSGGASILGAGAFTGTPLLVTLTVGGILTTASSANLPTTITTLNLNAVQTINFSALTNVTALKITTAQTSTFSLANLESLTVENDDPAAVGIVTNNFASLQRIKTVTFKGDAGHSVGALAFTSAALESVIFDATVGKEAVKVTLAANSFPTVSGFDAENDFFGNLRNSYGNGATGADKGVVGTYNYHAVNGWKKAAP